MNEITENSDDTRREMARHAARTAAQNIKKELENTPTTTGESGLALYVWGAVAVLSSAVALTSGFMDTTTSNQTIVAGKDSKNSNSQAAATQNSGTDSGKVASVDRSKAVSAENISKLTENDLRINGGFDKTTTGAIAPADKKPRPVSNAQLFGGHLGADVSIPKLSARYAALRRRVPELFVGLEPVVQIDESKKDLLANLVTGPFKTEFEAAQFCRDVKLALTIECKAVVYYQDN